MCPEKYEATWSSLKRHRTPEWLDNGKFGIYFHWGIYSVPAFGTEWYPNRMYTVGEMYDYHARTYGEPEEFGYKDLIPQFTAEHFDPNAWAELFKEAGATFAGPVAEHHDGFSMWDSKVNKWNAVTMGPKRDVVGEMEKAIRKQGLRYITTFHHSHNWYYYYHFPGLDTSDPEYAGLYGKPHAADNGIGPGSDRNDRPDKEFHEIWFAKLKEVINNYQPDLIWFDFGLKRIHEKYKRKFAAYYYNKAEEWGREVEILYKHHNMPPGMGVVDYERGRSDQLTYYKWITDTTVGTKSWSYIKDEVYKTPTMLVHNLVDNVAKNGYVLFNFGPTAQGVFPEEAQALFSALGQWLNTNGEAIYGSTPWVLAEEGPTKMTKAGDFSEQEEVSYTAEDLRFVTKGNALYVIALGWPASNILTVKSLAAPPKHGPGEFYLLEREDIQSLHLLGYEKPLSWDLTSDGLKIVLPTEKPCKHAYTVKIQWS